MEQEEFDEIFLRAETEKNDKDARNIVREKYELADKGDIDAEKLIEPYKNNKKDDLFWIVGKSYFENEKFVEAVECLYVSKKMNNYNATNLFRTIRSQYADNDVCKKIVDLYINDGSVLNVERFWEQALEKLGSQVTDKLNKEVDNGRTEYEGLLASLYEKSHDYNNAVKYYILSSNHGNTGDKEKVLNNEKFWEEALEKLGSQVTDKLSKEVADGRTEYEDLLADLYEKASDYSNAAKYYSMLFKQGNKGVAEKILKKEEIFSYVGDDIKIWIIDNYKNDPKYQEILVNNLFGIIDRGKPVRQTVEFLDYFAKNSNNPTSLEKIGRYYIENKIDLNKGINCYLKAGRNGNSNIIQKLENLTNNEGMIIARLALGILYEEGAHDKIQKNTDYALREYSSIINKYVDEKKTEDESIAVEAYNRIINMSESSDLVAKIFALCEMGYYYENGYMVDGKTFKIGEPKLLEAIKCYYMARKQEPAPIANRTQHREQISKQYDAQKKVISLSKKLILSYMEKEIRVAYKTLDYFNEITEFINNTHIIYSDEKELIYADEVKKQYKTVDYNFEKNTITLYTTVIEECRVELSSKTCSKSEDIRCLKSMFYVDLDEVYFLLSFIAKGLFTAFLMFSIKLVRKEWIETSYHSQVVLESLSSTFSFYFIKDVLKYIVLLDNIKGYFECYDISFWPTAGIRGIVKGDSFLNKIKNIWDNKEYEKTEFDLIDKNLDMLTIILNDVLLYGIEAAFQDIMVLYRERNLKTHSEIKDGSNNENSDNNGEKNDKEKPREKPKNRCKNCGKYLEYGQSGLCRSCKTKKRNIDMIRLGIL